MNLDWKKLLDTWERDLMIICHAHYDSANEAKKNNHLLGIPIVVISAIVGSSIFATLNENPDAYIKILTGILTIASGVLAALQTFMKWSEKAEKHREAGVRFGSLLKELEQLKSMVPTDETVFKEWCNSFRGKWDSLSLESSTIPPKIFKKKIAEVNKAFLARKDKV